MLRGVVVEQSVETARNSIELLMSCAMVLACMADCHTL